MILSFDQAFGGGGGAATAAAPQPDSAPPAPAGAPASQNFMGPPTQAPQQPGRVMRFDEAFRPAPPGTQPQPSTGVPQGQTPRAPGQIVQPSSLSQSAFLDQGNGGGG